MAVITIKPHILQYKVFSEGYEDQNGDYHEGTERWGDCIPCDAVPASGKSSEIRFDDGRVMKYSYTVYLNADVRDFSVGEIVRIRLLGGNVREFDVKGFQRWQMQCKLWV